MINYYHTYELFYTHQNAITFFYHFHIKNINVMNKNRTNRKNCHNV